jgi:hypothetical protein
MKYATAKERNTWVWEFTFPYDQAAVDVMRSVPSFFRDWDGVHKIWTVREEQYVNAVIQRLTNIGYEVHQFTLADQERERRERERFREEYRREWRDQSGRSNSSSGGTSGNRARGPTLEGAQDVFQALFNLVAYDRRDALYKALVRVFHPDVGGDEEQMKALNKVAGR